MKIDREHIGVAFDMQGCPNRCRHCWLGPGSSQRLSERDVRWGVSQFRDFIAGGTAPFKSLSVATWFREPDLRDDYRRLYELEAELSDSRPERYELLSVWRLARDETYAEWAKSIGPDTCQISLFGMRETNDWFYRRKGAFDDAVLATERLLDAGMKPRWQVFLTTKLIPELNELLALVERNDFRDRVRELGGEFQLFMHLPGPDYEARKIEKFRPTEKETAELPEAILESSRNYFGRDLLWQTEKTLYESLLNGDDTNRDRENLPEVLWFFVCSNWDVFTNTGTLEDWWCLGNLKRYPVETIVNRYENDETPGLATLFHESLVELAKRYGDPEGRRIYSGRGDLLSLYRGKHCEKM